MVAPLSTALVRRRALAVVVFSPLLVVPASADPELVVTSITNDGKLTFEDQGAAGTNFYGVEWSNDLSSWHDGWSSLEFLQTQDGAATTVDVPLFYRVTRLEEGANALPVPVADADYRNGGAVDAAKDELGKKLFWDKLLSGRMNISCATCHHTMAATSDGLSLPIGEGGLGLGIMRQAPSSIGERVPRNAPHLWNLGATEFTTMFHDGRVKENSSHPSGFDSPAGDALPAGLESVLAAQAMFPVTSNTEMAGPSDDPLGNPIGSLAAAGDIEGVWDAIAVRLRAIPEYVDLFVAAFDDVNGAEDITYAHAANAIAEHESALGRADRSPFDAYLRGDLDALSGAQLRGMRLFYGKANCASCHSGKFQTDHQFHAIAMPQIGPGKGDGDTGHGDHGRARETGEDGDLCAFRTPSLRNVALTGPWGHSGAYDSLEAVVRHHLDPAASHAAYDRSQAKLPSSPTLDPFDFIAHDDPAESAAIVAANELQPIALNDAEIADLVAFLHALTDPETVDLRRFVPTSVPSGLPVAD